MRSRPSSKDTFGSQSSRVRARVMSGWRTLGSSTGRGFSTIRERDPVRVRWIRAHPMPLPDDDGDVAEIALIQQDVTEERRRAVERLRESERRYQELFDSVLEGIGAIDENEIVEFCNPVFAGIFGYESPEAMAGASLTSLVPDDQREIFRLQSDARRRKRWASRLCSSARRRSASSSRCRRAFRAAALRSRRARLAWTNARSAALKSTGRWSSHTSASASGALRKASSSWSLVSHRWSAARSPCLQSMNARPGSTANA